MRTRRLAQAAALGAFLTAALLNSAAAQTPVDGVIEQLRAQGYQEFTVSRTFLGRIHIVAETDGRKREIVFNPTTGEILRDYAEAADGNITPQIVAESNDEDSETGGNEGSGRDNPSDTGGDDNSSLEDDGDPDVRDNDDGAGRPGSRDGIDGPDRNQTGDGGRPDAGNDGDSD